jgi:hypothetical protein
MELVNYIIVNNEKLIVRDVSGNGRRTRYTFVGKHNEIIDVELTIISCENNSFVKIWQKKYGALKRQKNYIAIDVCITDENGNCWSRYNPQVCNSKLNFAWLLKDTVENRKKILGEIIRRANEGK